MNETVVAAAGGVNKKQRRMSEGYVKYPKEN